jgi:uncharacterized membrane protein
VNTSGAARLGQAIRWGGALALGIGYAAASHLAATSAEPGLLQAAVAVMPLLALALILAWRSPQRPAMLALCALACLGFYAWRSWLLSHYHWVFFLEYTGSYSLLCATFGRTLARGRTPMISQFARIVHGELSPALSAYTRSATWAWTLYFAGIVGVSVVLFWLAPMAAWSTFAYLLGIPLLGLMFVAEYAARCCFLPPAERAGPLEAIRAYRQASSQNRVARP